VSGAPGLDLPGLDTAAIATGYGIGAVRVQSADELREALEEAITADRPELVEARVAPGMWLF
jgi:benzoylformate decarboxylase